MASPTRYDALCDAVCCGTSSAREFTLCAPAVAYGLIFVFMLVALPIGLGCSLTGTQSCSFLLIVGIIGWSVCGAALLVLGAWRLRVRQLRARAAHDDRAAAVAAAALTVV